MPRIIYDDEGHYVEWEIGDCLELMKDIPDNSIDLVLTDPPYGIGKDFANDNMPKSEYLDWCKLWIKELIRILDIGGTIYLTLGWQIVAEIKMIFDRYDVRLKNWIIWYRQDGWKGDNGFAQSHEHILYFIKDIVPPFDLIEFGAHIKEKRLEAGYKTIDSLMDEMGMYALVRRKSGKDGYYSGVGFFESGKKKPRLQELIRLNELLDLDEKYCVNTVLKDKNIDPKKFNVFFNKVDVCDDVWLTPKSDKKRIGHPTQKPSKLFERMILASTQPADIVFDPFLGSGTTLSACRNTGRNGIGFEINPDYEPLIKKRTKTNQLAKWKEYFGDD